MKCPNCQKRKAIIHPNYGVTFCKRCREDEDTPRLGVEFTTDSIKESRREYKKDIIQPYRDGVLSKEYLETYGKTGITATKEQIKNAKYVWKDTKGWWQRGKSKGGRNLN
jgi:hypothetical protein